MAAPAPPLTPPMAPPPSFEVGAELVAGVVFAILAAAGIAISMVTQRYALTYPNPKIPLPLIRVKASRCCGWFIGLIMYGAANGLWAAALNFGPLSMLGGVFMTMVCHCTHVHKATHLN